MILAAALEVSRKEAEALKVKLGLSEERWLVTFCHTVSSQLMLLVLVTCIVQNGPVPSGIRFACAAAARRRLTTDAQGTGEIQEMHAGSPRLRFV